MVVKTLKFLKEVYKLELATAMEYRLDFFMKSVGMFVNDLFWIFFWVLIFQRFTRIGTWDFKDMLFLYAVILTGFGLVMMLFAQARKLALIIENGGLDYYLTLPKPVLLYSIARTEYSGLGDFALGLVIAAFTLSLNQLPLFIVFIITTMLITLGLSILSHAGAFYFDRFYRSARAVRETFFIFATYPFSVYGGLLKFFLLFMFPVGMVSGVPVELLKSFSYNWLIVLVVFSVVFFMLAIFVFQKGLNQYSSGNAMSLRG